MVEYGSPEIIERKSIAAGDASIVIDPLKHSLVSDVRVCIFDNATRVLSSYVLHQNQVLRVPENLQKTKLKFKLQTFVNGKWCDFIPYDSILPSAFQASPPKLIHRFPGDLCATVRHNVILSPYRSLYKVNPPWGYFAAYENGIFIPESHHVVMGKQGYAPAKEPKISKRLSGKYIYGDCLGGAYGHVITEGISRLWYARQNPDIPIIWMRGSKLSQIHQQILDFLQIRNEHIFLREDVNVEEVVFPFPALSIGDYISPGYFDFVGVQRPEDPVVGKKVFLSRSKLDAPGRTQTGAAELDSLMQGFGFELFFPEQHGLKEQLRIISSAEIVVGIEGSAFHSLVFYDSVPKTRFVALGRHRMGAGIYSQIKHGKGLDYITLNMICGSRELRLNARSEVSLDIEILKNVLTMTHGFEYMENVPPELVCDDGLLPTRNYLDIVLGLPSKMNASQSVVTDLIANLDKMDKRQIAEKLGEIFMLVS